MVKFIFLSVLFVAVISITVFTAITQSLYLFTYGAWVAGSLIFAAAEPIGSNNEYNAHL